MELLGFVGFVVLFAGAGWLLVSYVKRIQDTSDRRYPESTDEGRLGSGGGSAFS